MIVAFLRISWADLLESVPESLRKMTREDVMQLTVMGRMGNASCRHENTASDT